MSSFLFQVVRGKNVTGLTTFGGDTDPTSLAPGPLSAAYVKNDNVWSPAHIVDPLVASVFPKKIVCAAVLAAGATTYKVKVAAYDADREAWYTVAVASASTATLVLLALLAPILERGVYAFVITTDDSPPPDGTYRFAFGFDWAQA
jgi:hypothetical protein